MDDSSYEVSPKLTKRIHRVPSRYSPGSLKKNKKLGSLMKGTSKMPFKNILDKSNISAEWDEEVVPTVSRKITISSDDETNTVTLPKKKKFKVGDKPKSKKIEYSNKNEETSESSDEDFQKTPKKPFKEIRIQDIINKDLSKSVEMPKQAAAEDESIKLNDDFQLEFVDIEKKNFDDHEGGSILERKENADEKLNPNIGTRDSNEEALWVSSSRSKMTPLGDTGFFCLENVYHFGISCAEKKETVLARRLLDGVIKPDIISVSTLSGKAPRAQGKERQKRAVRILHPGAVAAIKKFAREWAEKYADQGWTTQTEEKVKQSLRSRIVEIKANFDPENQQK